MVEREKVIKGLECCVTMPDIYPHCEECPYAGADETCGNLNGLHRDAVGLLKAQESLTSAIECLLHPQDADDSDMAKAIDTAVRAMRLLKAQEPRIVTEEEFKNADEAGFIPAWCEEKDTAEVYCECISIGALEDAKFGHMRWWTSRPTNKQREAIPWPD